MYVVRYGMIEPILIFSNFGIAMPDYLFFLLVLATTMIAAAGYVINDYFDVRIDKINKPDEVVVDNGVKRRVAMVAHTVINVLGILIGCYVSYKAQLLSIGSIIFVFSAISLWFYSTDFKRQFLTGNVIISLLSGMVPFLAGLFEMQFVKLRYQDLNISENINSMSNFILIMLASYSFFAFLISFMREIIKDAEDFEGDSEYGCRTLPVVMGIKTAKMVGAAFGAILISLLVYVQMDRYGAADGNLSFYYILVFIQIPLLLTIYKIVTANDKKDFRMASKLTKIIMLGGIFFWILFRYLLFTQTW